MFKHISIVYLQCMSNKMSEESAHLIAIQYDVPHVVCLICFEDSES